MSFAPSREDDEYKERKDMWQKNWETSLNDPNNFRYHTHGNITIIRDDMFCGGTKARFLGNSLDLAYIEYVYISSLNDPDQLAFCHAMRQLEYKGHKGKTGVIFMRNMGRFESLSQFPYIRLGKSMGIRYIFVGPKDDLYEKASSYCDADSDNRCLLKYGLDIQEASDNLVIAMKALKQKFHHFDECWSVINSGTLTRCLQKAGFADAYKAVSVIGIIQDIDLCGDAQVILHKQKHNEMIYDKHSPPFMSCPYSDAKVWQHVLSEAKQNPAKNYLFWNSS